MKYIIALLSTMTLVACASTELTSEGAKVKLMKNDPPHSCSEVGVVNSNTSGAVSSTPETNRNLIRNNAAAKGANYVRMETIGRTITGTAFKCPETATY